MKTGMTKLAGDKISPDQAWKQLDKYQKGELWEWFYQSYAHGFRMEGRIPDVAEDTFEVAKLVRSSITPLERHRPEANLQHHNKDDRDAQGDDQAVE